ncbi:MAG TPA: PKD domain-containing protein, partial [Methanothrix soehngenii]|nr:PKD domain-containing protein [Methanothrix soehngenii]
MTLDEMKREIALKLNVGHPKVRDEGLRMILEYSGDGTINQICSIYEHMVGNWSYSRDPHGSELLQYSNQSLDYGGGKYSGQGDCDDFAILLASLIESIGGTSRIILAYGLTGGHAYTEVYLGKAGGPDSDVVRMLIWLRKNYNATEINTHTNLETGDVWLNLDWWKNPNTGKDLAKHPGGPFFEAAKQVPIRIREDIPSVPLKPMNDLPIALFSISPLPPAIGDNTSFDASSSRDIGGRVESYLWDFGEDNKTEKMSGPSASHVYSKGGPYLVNLTIWDDEDAINISSQKITVNNPPQANFSIEPQRPNAGDLVKFDASASFDAEDGKDLKSYYWQINNNSTEYSGISPPALKYDESGLYWINLTVTDRGGASGSKRQLLKINEKPVPCIYYDQTNLSAKESIDFSAACSKDIDGEIIGYSWDFGDEHSSDCNDTAHHIYETGGNKMMNLSITDNDGAVSRLTKEIYINWPPTAKFSIDPPEPV